MFDGVRKNNPEAVKLFTEWKFILNEFINLIINTYMPNVICITGGLTKSKDLFLDEIIQNHPETSIKECAFGEYAGLKGAAVLALQAVKII